MIDNFTSHEFNVEVTTMTVESLRQLWLISAFAHITVMNLCPVGLQARAQQDVFRLQTQLFVISLF